MEGLLSTGPTPSSFLYYMRFDYTKVVNPFFPTRSYFIQFSGNWTDPRLKLPSLRNTYFGITEVGNTEVSNREVSNTEDKEGGSMEVGKTEFADTEGGKTEVNVEVYKGYNTGSDEQT